MARTNTLTNFLTDVATAIRTKSGTTGTIAASAFDTKIGELTNYKVDIVTATLSSTDTHIEFTVLGEPKAYALMCTGATGARFQYVSGSYGYFTSARDWDGTTCKTTETRIGYQNASVFTLTYTTNTTTTSSDIGEYNSSTNKFSITGLRNNDISNASYSYTLVYIY